MHLDDRLTIDTPEGVSIEVTLAGLGSRLGAAAIDLAIQGALLLVASLALTLAGSRLSGDLGVFLFGIGTLVVTAIVLGYYIVFEALNGGRTPGKAAFGLRVASVDGTPLSLGAVTLRTLLRLIDFLPVAYAIGAISVLVSPRNQRIGDLAAGTVVIRDRTFAPVATPAPATEIEGWDVSLLSEEEMAVIRRFAARRQELTPEARTRLAGDLAGRFRPMVNGGEGLGDEAFLVQLLAEKQSRR
ncbi:MAG: RDD family protein [Acidimicrobiia bacterium]